MVKAWLHLTLLLGVALGAGCANTELDEDAGPPRGDAGQISLAGLTGIRIDPADAVLSITSGPVTRQYRALGTFQDGSEWDITEATAFAVASHRVGMFSGSEFTSAASWGGKTTVTAVAGDRRAETGLTVRFERRFFAQGVSPEIEQAFDKAEEDPAASIDLVYPPKGVMVPPNLRGLEIQWVPSGGQAVFEIAFFSSAGDIRVYALCARIAGKGCGHTVEEKPWSQIARTFSGDEPLVIRVRGMTAARDGVGSSMTRTMSVATEPVKGGIYYWDATSGAIMRYDFGRAGAKTETFLGSSEGCVGCHSLSANGERIAVVGQGSMQVLEVASQKYLASKAANFTALAPDGTRLISSRSTGIGQGQEYLALEEAATLTSVLDPFQTQGTMPDWSADGTHVAYVEGKSGMSPYSVANGSIKLVRLDAAKGSWTSPSTLVAAADGSQNNFYPTLSPDGSLLVFNRAPSGHSYDNSQASLWAVLTAGGKPVELSAANHGTDLTNSWPKFSPFIQSKGRKLVWLTFSSRREHGLRTTKSSGPGPMGGGDRNQAQIWMAALDLGKDELGCGDPSYPAFWLPFQDPKTGNHIAQWAAEVARQPCGIDGDCPEGQKCRDGLCEIDE